MTRRAAFVLALLVAALPAVAAAKAVLMPDAAARIQAAFERMKPRLRYESIRLEEDHVTARVCATEPPARCFSLRLDDPSETSAGHRAGPFRVSFPDEQPPSDLAGVIDGAIAADTGPSPFRAVTTGTETFQPPGLPPPRIRPFGPTRPRVIALLLAASLAIFALWRRRAARSHGAATDRPSDHRADDRGADLALAAIVAIGAALWLDAVTGPAWAGRDQATSLLLVDDCIRLSQCHLTGVDSGLRGFVNGATWLHLLTAVGLLGGSTAAVRATLIGLMAAGVGLLFLCTRRWLDRAYALPAAILVCTALTGVGDRYQPDAVGAPSAANLIDVSGAFLPAVLCAGGLLVFVSSRRYAALAVAAVAASHVMTMHAVGASLAPALLAAAVLAARSPILGVVIAVALHGAATLVTSPFTVLAAWTRAKTALPVATLVGLAIVIGAAALGRSRFLRLRKNARAAVIGALLVAPTIAGAILLRLQHRPPTTRYLPPIAAPLAVGVAALLVYVTALPFVLAGVRAGIGARIVRALQYLVPVAAALWCLTLGRAPQDSSKWIFEDGRVIAEKLEREGRCYTSQIARSQATQCTPLAYALMPFACHGKPLPAGSAADRRQIRAWLTDADRLPAQPGGAVAYMSAPGRAVLVDEFESWLDLSTAERCVTTWSGPGDSGEGRRTCATPFDTEAEPFFHPHRISFGFDSLEPSPRQRVTFTFQVSARGGESRELTFGDEIDRMPSPPADAGPRCGWYVSRVENLDVDRPLPANPVRLTARSDAPARLVLERVIGGPCGGTVGEAIPCHRESLADDPPWMRE